MFYMFPMISFPVGVSYFMVSFMVLFVSSPAMIWFMMEVLMVFFMSLSYFMGDSSNYKSLMSYYVIQSAASMGLLMATILDPLHMMSKFVVLLCSVKLGLFPVSSWYYSVLSGLSWFPFFMVTLPQKLPVMAFILTFQVNFFGCFSFIIMVFMMLLYSFIVGSYIIDMKSVLIWSSLVNGAWMIMAVLSGYWIFLLFYFFYFLVGSLLIFLVSIQPHQTNLILLLLLTLMGLPPLPLFFLKVVVVIFLSASYYPYVGVFLFSVMFLSSFIMMMYYRQAINIMMK